jgi:2'-5' RNA ligase
MSHELMAVDVALLLPPEVRGQAIALSAALPAEESEGLRLDEDHVPHVTLTQQFVRRDELEPVFERVDGVLRETPALPLRVTGSELSGHSIWMALEPSASVTALHEQLMEALHGLERPEGGAAAFADGDARLRDVFWVAGYRLKSSFGAYTPHVTLGHGSRPPSIAPFSFEAQVAAVCHLGRFCTCRHVLRQWPLKGRR